MRLWYCWREQLLTIARAMLYDARKLILDEAASNVDTSTERKIQNAGHILVIDHGDVVEQGNHVSLMRRKGFYYKLYSAQFE